jgi:hypothetical protein
LAADQPHITKTPKQMIALDFVGEEPNILGKSVDQAEDLQIRSTVDLGGGRTTRGGGVTVFCELGRVKRGRLRRGGRHGAAFQCFDTEDWRSGGELDGAWMEMVVLFEMNMKVQVEEDRSGVQFSDATTCAFLC